MGVKLQSLIAVQKIELKTLNNTRLAIDGMNMLFQILYNPIQAKQKLPDYFYLDSTQRVITHLYGWLQKVSHLYKHKIFPIVVFDGKPDTFKRLITKDYARDFIAVKKMYEECLAQGNPKEAKNHALGKTYMFMNCVQESKRLLEACGIPVIMAPSEAESQCVALQKQGLVDYIISTDYDVLLYGASKIIRQLTFQTKQKIKGQWQVVTPTLDLIDVQQNLTRLNLSQSQLIEMSLLLGTDYNKGLPGIGQTKALQSIQYYQNIKSMIAKHPERFNSLSYKKINQIKELFLSPEVIDYSSNINKLQLKPFNEIDLTNLLLKDHTLNQERVQKKIT